MRAPNVPLCGARGRLRPGVQVTATGQIPSWLQGTLIRNVPNTYEVGNDEVWSWTDALASIHLIKLNGTNAGTHTARNFETVSYKQAIEKNGLPFTQFMTPANGGPRPKGGHVPFPCFGGPCLPDNQLQHALGHPQPPTADAEDSGLPRRESAAAGRAVWAWPWLGAKASWESATATAAAAAAERP